MSANLPVRIFIRADTDRRFSNLINDTYKHLYGYSELSQKQIDQYIKMYLSLLDLNFCNSHNKTGLPGS